MFMTHLNDLNLIKKLAFGCFTLVVAFVVVAPQSVSAQTFEPANEGELVAYMFGILDTLQAQVDAKNGTVSNGGSSRVNNSNASLDVETKVTLKAQFTATNNSAVYAWFEYGEGSKLSSKTTRTKAAGTGTNRTHARTLTGLKSGMTYTYRPVFEVNEVKYYGATRTFSTSGTGGAFPLTGGSLNNNNSNNNNNNSNGSSVSTSKGSMSFEKTTYKSYDSIELEWTVPSSRRGSGNWIGLFETGDDNDEYQSWQYLKDSTRGTVTFTAPGEGTYEFRLFYNNEYSDVLTSRKITVTD